MIRRAHEIRKGVRSYGLIETVRRALGRSPPEPPSPNSYLPLPKASKKIINYSITATRPMTLSKEEVVEILRAKDTMDKVRGFREKGVFVPDYLLNNGDDRAIIRYFTKKETSVSEHLKKMDL